MSVAKRDEDKDTEKTVYQNLEKYV